MHARSESLLSENCQKMKMLLPYFTSTVILFQTFAFISGDSFKECIDSPLDLGVKRNPLNNNKLVFRTCESWANPWRCKNFPGVAEACPKTCNKCELSECKDSPFRFRYPLQNSDYSGKTRTCKWVATGNTRKKCNRPGVAETCRETCAVCAKKSCFNAYPAMEGLIGNYIGNGRCDNIQDLNTAECGFDGGDCAEFNSLYPGCTYSYPLELGNDRCLNNNEANTAECKFDGGDCNSFNEQYPNCEYENAFLLGDGVCYPNNISNTAECGYDGGDCIE